MIPRPLFRLDVPEGTRLTLCALYVDVDDVEQVRAWEEGRSDLPPFVWRLAGYEPLQEVTGRSRSRIADDLRQLADLGVIRRATRDGRRGWDLVGTRRDRAVPPAGPSRGTLGSQSADARVPPAGCPGPTNGTRPAAPDVPPAGPTGPSRGTSGSRQRDPARVPASPRAVLIPTQQHRDEHVKPTSAGRGGAANDRPSSAATSSPRNSSLPRPASPVQVAARPLLLELVRTFDGFFQPGAAEGLTLESRRIRPDVETLRRLGELLTPPDDVDAEAWLERQVELVRGYVRDYATICSADPAQAHHWGSDMLEPRPRKGQVSAWEATCRIVDRWREGQVMAARDARATAAAEQAAERRQVADRIAELEQLARVGETPGARAIREQLGLPARDVAAGLAAAHAACAAASAAGREPTLAEVDAAVAAAQPPQATPLPSLPGFAKGDPGRPPLTTEDEEQLRRRGHGREASRQRADTDSAELALRINRALAEARRLKGDSLTPEEAEFIKRRLSGEEATGT